MDKLKANSIFSTNLKELLRAKKKTQKALAEHLGISPATVTYWINGRNLPDHENVKKICLFLNITRDQLLDSPSAKAPEPKKQLTLEDVESGDLQIYFSNGKDFLDLPKDQQDDLLEYLSFYLLKEEKKKRK